MGFSPLIIKIANNSLGAGIVSDLKSLRRNSNCSILYFSDAERLFNFFGGSY
jgi:hypothetical protein